MSKIDSGEKRTLLLTNVRNQYLAIVTANFLMLANGCALGWPVQFLPKLQSLDTPLASGPLANDEISWIMSISYIGSLLSLIGNGFFISIFGAKRFLLSASVPMIIFWLLIHLATDFYWILLARFISGWTNSTVYLALILFSSEVANDNIRGSLTSLTMCSNSFGSLIAYVLGSGLVEYDTIPYIGVTMPIIFAALFILLPNTPRYYLAKGEVQKAEDALKFYKGYKGKDPMEDDAIAAELEKLKNLQNEQSIRERLCVSDFFNRIAIKGILIGCSLYAITHFTAYYTLMNYATLIFSQTDTTLFSPYVSTIIMAVALASGSILSAYLADAFGRKTIIIASLIACVIGLFSVATYHYLYLQGYDLSSFKWVPTSSISFTIFVEAAGIVPITIVCSFENLPSKIRNVGMSIVVFMANLILFGILKVFPLLLNTIDVHGCMIMFAILSLLGVIFVAAFLKETNGQSLDDIGLDQKTKTEISRA